MLDSSKLMDAIGGTHEEKESIIERLRFADSLDVPIELTDSEMWANYVNEDLYEMDKKVREFLKKTKYTRLQKGGYRTTASLVFAWIYGRQPTAKDSSACRMLHELLRYYCTGYTGKTTFNGKKVPRVYVFSKYAFSKKRPYSLKLRLEESGAGKNIWRKSPGYNRDKRGLHRQDHRGNSE